MWKTTIRGLAAHKLRLALTALAVVLGVGFISGTYVLTDTMNRSFENLFANVTEGVDLYVRRGNAFLGSEGDEERKPLPENLLATVAEVEGVEEAEGTVTGYAQLVDRSGEAVTTGGAPTIGVSWSGVGGGDGEAESDFGIRQGRAPQGPGEVLIDEATAADHDFSIGDRVQILLQGSPETFTLVGTAGSDEADFLLGATLAAFELDTAQRVLDKEDQFDAIEVAVEDGASVAGVRDRFNDVLPKGIETATGQAVADEQATAIQDALGFFNIALLVFATVALFVGAFVIFNTFSITVAQRTREFALLRALGATWRQVMTSVLIEAVIVGLIASALGLGAGVLIAMGLNALLTAFGIDLPQPTLQLLPRTVAVSMLVGTGITVVSSIFPARRAAKVSPMAALREATPQLGAWSKRRTAAGMVVTAVGASLIALGLFTDVGDGITFVGLGAFLTFIGVAVLSPLFAGPLAKVIGAPPARAFKMPAKLGRANAARNPKRTASTAAALMIGLALVGFVSIFAASLKESSNAIIDDSLKADFIVSNSSFGGTMNFSPEVARSIASRPEIEAAAGVRFGEFHYRDSAKFMTAVDAGAIDEVVSLGVRSGRIGDLMDGGVFVHVEAAQDLKLNIGDTLEMEFPATGSTSQRVEGLFDEDTVIGSQFIVSKETYRENFTQNLDDVVFVSAAAGASSHDARAAVDAAIEKFPNVTVQDQTEFKETQASQVNQLLGLVTALLGLSLIIALLGITNTLALSVFERTREIGLLRAVGMTRRQARSMIRWEAVIVSVIGALLGLTVGTFFGWALVTALEAEGISELVVPGGQLAGYVAVAGLAGVIAALPPARRAARMDVLGAIATE
jgi:putative ABC transport system permease protein